MNKIIIKLYIPTIGFQYDIWISSKCSVETTINLLVKGINELTYGEYNVKRLPNLYNKKTGEAYNLNEIIGNTDIANGTELMLI